MSALLTAAAAASVFAGLGGGAWLSARLGAAERRALLVKLAEAQQETAQAQVELAKAEHAATHDALTGVANRAKLYSFGQVAVRESTTPVAVAIFDLDKFKPINDTWGHHVGDAVLREVAARIEHELGGSGFVARLGGDEFAAVLAVPAGTDAGIWNRLADAADLVAEPITVAGRTHRVRVSVGAAKVEPGAQTEFAEVLRAADAAMYAAKERGTGPLWHSFVPGRSVVDRPVTRLRDVPAEQSAVIA